MSFLPSDAKSSGIRGMTSFLHPLACGPLPPSRARHQPLRPCASSGSESRHRLPPLRGLLVVGTPSAREEEDEHRTASRAVATRRRGRGAREPAPPPRGGGRSRPSLLRDAPSPQDCRLCFGTRSQPSLLRDAPSPQDRVRSRRGRRPPRRSPLRCSSPVAPWMTARWCCLRASGISAAAGVRLPSSTPVQPRSIPNLPAAAGVRHPELLVVARFAGAEMLRRPVGERMQGPPGAGAAGSRGGGEAGSRRSPTGTSSSGMPWMRVRRRRHGCGSTRARERRAREARRRAGVGDSAVDGELETLLAVERKGRAEERRTCGGEK
jgi:hypothetical protein